MPFSIISLANILIVFKLTGFSCLPFWLKSKLKRSDTKLNGIKIKFRNSRYEKTQSVLICQNENSMAQYLRNNPSGVFSSESNSSNAYKTNNTTTRTLSCEKNTLSMKKLDSSSMYKRSLTMIPKYTEPSDCKDHQRCLSMPPRSISLKIKNEYSSPSFYGLNKTCSNSYISLMTTTNFTKRMKVYSRTTIILLTISTAYLIL